MSKLNDLATIQILSNINEKKISNLSDKSKKKDFLSEKNLCIAAVRYNTIGNAYKDRMNNVDVYLIKEFKNNNTKTHAYSRCSKTTQDGILLCHLHCRMTKLNNAGLKIFEKDILPLNPNDNTRWLANINDDFFENMGKRGAKKKNSENNFTFPNENNPVLLILTHKNAKLSTQLSIYASQLLKNSNYICPEIITNNINDNYIKNIDQKKNKKTVKPDNNTSENLTNLISMISTIDKSSKLFKKSNISEDNGSGDCESEDSESEDSESEDSESEDSESEDSCSGEHNIENIESGKNKSTNKECNKDSLNDDEASCISICTNKDELLWYDEDNHIVYEPEEDDGGKEIGFLKEISDEYHTIKYNNKLYTVLKEINVKNQGNVYCCVLTDTLFNNELNFIGIRTKIKNNEYRFDFIK
jgi:hypothetical protein